MGFRNIVTDAVNSMYITAGYIKDVMSTFNRVRADPGARDQLEYCKTTDHRLYLEIMDALEQLDQSELYSKMVDTPKGLMHFAWVDLPGSKSTSCVITWQEDQKTGHANVTYIGIPTA